MHKIPSGAIPFSNFKEMEAADIYTDEDIISIDQIQFGLDYNQKDLKIIPSSNPAQLLVEIPKFVISGSARLFDSK